MAKSSGVVEGEMETTHSSPNIIDVTEQTFAREVLDRSRQVPVVVDYVGFDIDDQFVVGYGLDHAGRYRALPYIAVVK